MTGLWDALIKGFSDIMQFFQSITGSYGLAIILLTVAVRLLLWPLTHSQVVSTRRMQALQPELEKLRKKHGNDQARLNQEMMKLWRENKINPASGCLPLLVQMPIFIALYQAILKFPALQGAAFLWIPSLAAKDPYYILPVVAGVTTYFQMRMTTPSGTPQQPAQQMMTWVFPVMMVYFTIVLPAGLGLYWAVGNLLTILQQKIAYASPMAPRGNASA